MELRERRPAYLDQVLSREFNVAALLNLDASIQVTDDQPYNEYYLLRQLLRRSHN